MRTRLGISIALLFLAAGSANASVSNDQVQSQHIREADGTSGQDTNSGAGVKTGHIQDGAVTDAKISGMISAGKLPIGNTAGTIAAGDHGHDGVYQRKFANVVVVALSGGDYTDPIAAVSSITDASETNPYLVMIMPGVYNVGSQVVDLPYSVDLIGSGQHATFILGNGASVVRSAVGNTEIRSLTVINQGNPSGSSCAISVSGSIPCRIMDVTAITSRVLPYPETGILVAETIVDLQRVIVDAESGTGIMIYPRFASDPPVTLSNVTVSAGSGNGIQANSGYGGKAVLDTVRVTSASTGLISWGNLEISNCDIQADGYALSDEPGAVAMIMNSRFKGAISINHSNFGDNYGTSTKISSSLLEGDLQATGIGLKCFQVHDADFNGISCP